MKEAEIYNEQNKNLITNYLNFKNHKEQQQIENVNEELKHLKHNPKAVTPQKIISF